MSERWYADTGVRMLDTPWPYPKQRYTWLRWLCGVFGGRLKVGRRSVKLALVFMQAFPTESEHPPVSIPAFSLACH